MKDKDIKWCPQHGYPLPCHKCGMPLSQTSQKEIYQAGIREVVERIDNTGLIEHTNSPLHETGATILDCPACCWYAYKKEWGV